jgi:hypothetical protein
MRSARIWRRANAWRDCGDRVVRIRTAGVPEAEQHDSVPGARHSVMGARRSTCAASSTPKRDVTKFRSRTTSGAVLEPPAFVSGLDDVAVVSEAIEQRGRHFWIAKDARPIAEGEIGGDDDRAALVEPADEMEQQLAAGLGEGKIAEFIEDDEVEAREIIGDAALATSAAFGLELVEEVDGCEEASARSGADAASCDGD